MIGKLDQIIARSLRKLAEDTHVRSWCAKEHDWMNYFAHRYLLGECSPRGPLKEAGQIGLDVAVPQPPGCGYDKQSVGRDLVIWPKCGDTCFDVNWKASKHPLAILEWKVHRPGYPNRRVEHERVWLRNYCKWQPSVIAYAVEINGRCTPTTLDCTRFLASTENEDWLRLTLKAGPSDYSLATDSPVSW
jgi:hypothetical protein